MVILTNCNYVSTTEWLFHSEKTPGEKLDGNYTRILYAVLYKS